MALKKALYVCRDLGLSNITFEGNCLQVIQAVEGDDQPTNDTLDLIIFDIQFLLKYNRKDWKVVYINKEANNSAHCLDKMTCNSLIDSIWIDECPECILLAVLVDMFYLVFPNE